MGRYLNWGMSKSLYLYALLVLAVGMAVVEIVAGLDGVEASSGTQLLYGIIVLVLTALWASEDSKHTGFDKPFEFGFLIYIFWPVLLPWYLYSTRKADGLVMFLGILAIFLGPWLIGTAIYVYYA